MDRELAKYYLRAGASFSVLGWGVWAFLILLYLPDTPSLSDHLRLCLYLLPVPALTFGVGVYLARAWDKKLTKDQRGL